MNNEKTVEAIVRRRSYEGMDHLSVLKLCSYSLQPFGVAASFSNRRRQTHGGTE